MAHKLITGLYHKAKAATERLSLLKGYQEGQRARLEAKFLEQSFKPCSCHRALAAAVGCCQDSDSK